MVQENKKYPVSDSYVCWNALFISEIRGEWSDRADMKAKVTQVTTLYNHV